MQLVPQMFYGHQVDLTKSLENPPLPVRLAMPTGQGL